MDVLDHASLAFPRSLPEFQRLFPDDAACAAYLEKSRWDGGFVCPHCRMGGEPFRFDNRPGVLRCRKCRKKRADGRHGHGAQPYATERVVLGRLSGRQPNAGHVGGAVPAATGPNPLRDRLRHPAQAARGHGAARSGRIGGRVGEHVEVDETYVGGKTRGEGRGVHHKTLVAAAVEVRHRKPGTAQDKRKDGRYAGRVRLAIAPDRSAETLCEFVGSAVMPGTLLVTDDWSAYGSLRARGYDHHAIAECGDPEVAEEFLPISHLVF